jgi:hypothetical protein
MILDIVTDCDLHSTDDIDGTRIHEEAENGGCGEGNWRRDVRI